MEIITLGACCKRSLKLFDNAKEAVRRLGLDVSVQNIGDMHEIARYGVMQTPALVINKKVVSYGKVLTVEQIMYLIQKYMA